MKNATCKLHLRVCALTREVAAALPSLLLPVAAESRVRPSALTGRITGISLSLNSKAPILTFPEEASGVHARGGLIQVLAPNLTVIKLIAENYTLNNYGKSVKSSGFSSYFFYLNNI